MAAREPSREGRPADLLGSNGVPPAVPSCDTSAIGGKLVTESDDWRGNIPPEHSLASHATFGVDMDTYASGASGRDIYTNHGIMIRRHNRILIRNINHSSVPTNSCLPFLLCHRQLPHRQLPHLYNAYIRVPHHLGTTE